MHRLFRTETYNIAEKRNISHTIQDMLPDDIQVLQGHKIQEKRKLLKNSPLIQELIYSDYDYRLLSLGVFIYIYFFLQKKKNNKYIVTYRNRRHFKR